MPIDFPKRCKGNPVVFPINSAGDDVETGTPNTTGGNTKCVDTLAVS